MHFLLVFEHLLLHLQILYSVKTVISLERNDPIHLSLPVNCIWQQHIEVSLALHTCFISISSFFVLELYVTDVEIFGKRRC
jgi:hypothetical protein